ncbi:hypothetical protein [Cohnella cholangitidis]|uniref:Uncharacterized protein n=1 Tax=Cohnella cholangitidis TaxID=2598458 RepID=A0A7G5C0D8_9BACL|nr:hypothetical protein [Cohnella cholangitidis]QMV42672.1 hypothetical protein FPL14_16860 [Cohnella cholangitidis]
MKKWIEEVITKRYEALSEETENKGELMTIKEQANTYENLLIETLLDETQEALNKWMEIHDQMVSFQK